MRFIFVTLISLSLSFPASADLKQRAMDQIAKGAEKSASLTHQLLVKAQKIGFFVDEVRFEVSVTPKIEVYLRDKGDNGNFEKVIGTSGGVEEKILRSLQATRSFSVAHYSPTGIKLTTGIAKPVVEILTSFQE